MNKCICGTDVKNCPKCTNSTDLFKNSDFGIEEAINKLRKVIKGGIFDKRNEWSL